MRYRRFGPAREGSRQLTILHQRPQRTFSSFVWYHLTSCPTSWARREFITQKPYISKVATPSVPGVERGQNEDMVVNHLRPMHYHLGLVCALYMDFFLTSADAMSWHTHVQVHHLHQGQWLRRGGIQEWWWGQWVPTQGSLDNFLNSVAAASTSNPSATSTFMPRLAFLAMPLQWPKPYYSVPPMSIHAEFYTFKFMSCTHLFCVMFK